MVDSRHALFETLFSELSSETFSLILTTFVTVKNYAFTWVSGLAGIVESIYDDLGFHVRSCCPADDFAAE